ncbi:RING finger and WD repeat domain-containing protein 3 [Paramicrosporidium saccamoebae]|uniref:RING finger and WD repeat domain-containing protein 3 n=1 Tax=Paramicrosporidium saccamoebae TaxID=1246581 RepID=A0A2H9TJA0_9FUNG|nr:RING finger and WD repeat domain-containing protein 3 [Paramicrosporidium saccamoebae]
MLVETLVETDDDVQLLDSDASTASEFDTRPTKRVCAEPEVVKPLSEEESDDDHCTDGCPICFEPWSSGGLHRVCSLRCGHLFGKQYYLGLVSRW